VPEDRLKAESKAKNKAMGEFNDDQKKDFMVKMAAEKDFLSKEFFDARSDTWAKGLNEKQAKTWTDTKAEAEDMKAGARQVKLVQAQIEIGKTLSEEQMKEIAADFKALEDRLIAENLDRDEARLKEEKEKELEAATAMLADMC